MKKFHYAVQKANGSAHVLTVPENQNLINVLKQFDFVVVHPCKTYAEAVKIVEAWKEVQKCVC